MATRMSPDHKDAALRDPVGDEDEEEVAELLVALRRQIDATEKLIAQTGGLLREIDVHQRLKPPARTPSR